MKTEVLTRRENLLEVRQQWELLAQSDQRDGFFRTPAWCLPWLEHIRRDSEPFVIVVRNGLSEIVGLAPLCNGTYCDHGLRLNAISPIGREVVSGDLLDFLAAPGIREEVLEAVLNCLWDSRSQWDLLVAGEVLEGGDLHKAFARMAERERLPLNAQEQRICPFIELPHNFEEYLKGLSQKMRYEIRRDSRKLLESWDARIDVYSDPLEVCANLDVMIELHLAHWRHIGQAGTLGRPGFRDFLMDVCARLPEGASTRLYILKHEEKPAAALLAFCFGENTMFYQTGWDPDSTIAHLSPGMVLVARSIRDAIEGGFRYFDFLRGDEQYKMRLTKTTRRTVTLLLGRSFIAKEYLRAARLKDSVKRIFGSVPSGAALQNGVVAAE